MASSGNERFTWKTGRMLFTGPDELWDHRVTVEPNQMYIGETPRPIGLSDSVGHVFSYGVSTPFPKSRNHGVGAIGWGVPDLQRRFYYRYAGFPKQVFFF